MSPNTKLVLGLLVVGFAVVGILSLRAPSEPPQVSQKVVPSVLRVGMEAYSSGNAHLGQVKAIIRDDTGIVAIHITSNGPLTRGVRRVGASQFYIPAQYVVVRMQRHIFRLLPRIDKKKR